MGHVRIKLYKNLDSQQRVEITGKTLADTIANVEKWIRTHNDECDGLTVGTPEVNWYHVLHFIEGERYASLAWELETYYQDAMHENECGTFEEMCDLFLDKCRDMWQFVR